MYANDHDRKDHVALIAGDLAGAVARGDPIHVRLHSECLTGDIFHSRRCDCGEQLRAAMDYVSNVGVGVVLYLRQEGRGIGLLDKLRAYNLQDQGHDTVESNLRLGHQADERDYTGAALILSELNITHVRLLTNNPAKVDHLLRLGVPRVERVPLQAVGIYADNFAYLKTKVVRMNHMITNLDQYGALDQAVRKGRKEHDNGKTDDLARSADSSEASSNTTADDFVERTLSDIERTSGIDSASLSSSLMRLVNEAEALVADMSALFPPTTTGAADMSAPQRPFVTATWAQSLNGAVAAPDGGPLALSGPVSSVMTHRMRAAHDAILVGVRTVLADNPRLTARPHPNVHARQPRVVVLDALLRTPATAALLAKVDGRAAAVLFCGPRATEERRRALQAEGAVVEVVDEDAAGLLNIHAVLARLAALGVSSVMVEGGPSVLRSFADARVVDRVIMTIAPRFVAGSDRRVDLTGISFKEPVVHHTLGHDSVMVANVASSS